MCNIIYLMHKPVPPIGKLDRLLSLPSLGIAYFLSFYIAGLIDDEGIESAKLTRH